MHKIIGRVLQANNEFNLIENGDKIAVGVSGGKDSFVLLKALIHIKKFLNFNIDVMAITVDMGFDEDINKYSAIEKLCFESEIKYIVKKTKVANIVFKERKEKNPCSLCSKMRRGIINSVAKENLCNKVAFGHNFEDVVETFIMNLFVGGRIFCFSPKTYFSDNNLYLIRPLVFVKEEAIKKVVLSLNFDVIKNPCPEDGNTYRQTIKELINSEEKRCRGFKHRLFGALT